MELFCSWCGVGVGSEAELAAHVDSTSHQLAIMSDAGREWSFRAPPRGLTAQHYALCNTYVESGKCRLGGQCCEAHGEDELAEWCERFAYRQQKLQRARDCELQGGRYAEALLERWAGAVEPGRVVADAVEGVHLSLHPSPSLTVAEKTCHREWMFALTSKTSLKHAALLHETHRNHFKISQLKCQHDADRKEINLGLNCQEWNTEDMSDFTDHSYQITVVFETSVFGTFRQDVALDFGHEPVLVKQLCVDVVSHRDMQQLQQAREQLCTFTPRWSSDGVTVVPFENKPYALGASEEHLLSLYPPPSSSSFVVTQAVMEPRLTHTNYTHRLHQLLALEEMAQNDMLSRYNVQAVLQLTSCYLLTPNSAVTAKYAHAGELFASMKLTAVLSEDSASGRLVLSNCSTVFLAPKGCPHRKVYEAVIEDKGKTVIYIRLSKQCTEELNLKADREMLAEVQFQLNRLPLVEMHFAVDRLRPPSLLFPDLSQQPLSLSATNNLNMSFEAELNDKQKEAILAITTPLNQRLPPVLIIGPFGTGKTYTLAQAVKAILREPSTRVLVCTHSNSAADIYIREYLDPLVQAGREECRPLRVYFRHRWAATVGGAVLRYCLVEGRAFRMPTADDVRAHRVVVSTLATSRYLTQLGLEKGFFTHILIDEAAQAMECEAIMPLSLASEHTRIVLAGDHMQLSPEVYSAFCRTRQLHGSLLERLHDVYPTSCPYRVLLRDNYRSHSAIVSLASRLFYSGQLRAAASQPPHPRYHPLSFFTAKGQDVQDVNSTAFHNYAEVFEIVERVIELKNNWPKEWGDQDDTSIGVVTPYYDQVVRIRAELRKKKLHGVSVERVLNVQGKQFRVIVLSCVRTRGSSSMRTSDTEEEEPELGFLSSARLLNTAVTRAQSLVAVVGDPLALCSVGKCRKLWEEFIEECVKAESLFGVTWDELRAQLDGLELKKNFVLNPLAPEFVPGRAFHGPAPNPPPFVEWAPPPHPFVPPQAPANHIPFQRPFVRHGGESHPSAPVDSNGGEMLQLEERMRQLMTQEHLTPAMMEHMQQQHQQQPWPTPLMSNRQQEGFMRSRAQQEWENSFHSPQHSRRMLGGQSGPQQRPPPPFFDTNQQKLTGGSPWDNSSFTPSEPPLAQTSLLEKLGVLQQVLPRGTDLAAFLDSEAQQQAFARLLLAAEGGDAARRLLALLSAIHRDQQLLQLAHRQMQARMMLARRQNAFAPPSEAGDQRQLWPMFSREQPPPPFETPPPPQRMLEEDNGRRLWAPDADSPFHFSEPARSGSYLSKLRGISNSSADSTTLFQQPSAAEAPGASPLSSSYPDIPDILASHVLPRSEPPFLPYSSDNGLTYAKILRSQHP